MSTKERTPEKGHWQLHLDAYNALFAELENNAEYPPLLPELVAAAKEFANEQFSFFLEGFYGDTPYLEPSEELPAEYVLQATLSQIANDLTVLEKVTLDWWSQAKRPTLQQATVLTNNALQLAITNGLIAEDAAVFIYLNKQPVIRVIPYAKVALIGIPYTAVESPADLFDTHLRRLLAIPHEVGHYVFWHGRYQDQRIVDHLQVEFADKKLDHYWHWAEEIFADVYSSLVGGSVTAASMKAILSDNDPHTFDLDDGAHPPDIIRPYIYAYAHEKAGFLRTSAEESDYLKRWESSIKKGDGQKRMSFKRGRFLRDSGRTHTLTFEDIPFGTNEILDGRKIFEVAVELVCELFQVTPPVSWTNDENDPYEELRSKINNPASVLHRDRFTSSEREQLPLPCRDAGFIAERDRLRHSAELVPIDQWRPIFEAGGWKGGGEEDGYRTIE